MEENIKNQKVIDLSKEILQGLLDRGYIRRDDVSSQEPVSMGQIYTVTAEGLNYQEVTHEEKIKFWKQSIAFPIIVSIMACIITNLIIH